MKAIDRLKQYIDLKEYSNSSFEKENSLSNGYIGTQLRRNADLGESVFVKILDNCLDLNPEWLLTGNGEMLKTKSEENATILNGGENGGKNGDNPKVKKMWSMDPSEKPTYTEEASKKNGNLIPLYDGLVAAGTALQADLSPQMEPVEYVDAGDWFRDATAAMRVHGDSMHPEYHSGSIIAMKRVNNKRLIVFGQDYVIETSEYRVLKRLQRSDEKEYWTLASVNTEIWEVGPLKGKLIHEPFDVHVDDVARLFKVLGCVKRNESSRIVHNQSLK